MSQRRTYILSVREPEGKLVLEDVRTRRRALLADLTEIGGQISSWEVEDGEGPIEDSARSGPAPSPRRALP